WISGPRDEDGPDNEVGYAGYRFNCEEQIYCVRFRHYSPRLGRWLERDPAGYVDGGSLYEYVRSSPVRYNDPFGLECCDSVLDRICNAQEAVRNNCGPFIADVDDLLMQISLGLLAAGVGTEGGRYLGDKIGKAAADKSARVRPDLREGMSSIEKSIADGDLNAKGKSLQKGAKAAKAAGNAIGAVGVLLDTAIGVDAVIEGDNEGATSAFSSAALGILAFTNPVAAAAAVGGAAGLYWIDRNVLGPARNADEQSRRRTCALNLQGLLNLLGEHPECAEKLGTCP
ncbi:MAG: RHS repeat-associated core domain-containing protein, partial [Phycisphaeraceae bacterium]|nr:RHS repeat-associated core domain-containing protein [Phycisphaeraceae bacterium]MCW5764328.1 RHS repeat-associated core domain-containing protein [Phycisphaeraceae bacterium]